MRKTIDQRICDHCNAVMEYSAPQYGGTPFAGWLQVEIIEHGAYPAAKKFDFCSKKCCIEFLGNQT